MSDATVGSDADDDNGGGDSESDLADGGAANLDGSLLGTNEGGADSEAAAAARLRRRAPSWSDEVGILGDDDEEPRVEGHLELGTARHAPQAAAARRPTAPRASPRSPTSSDAGSMASGRAGQNASQRSLRAFSLLSDSSYAMPVRQPVLLHVVCPQLHVLGLADNLLTTISGLERLTKLETLDLRSNRLSAVGDLAAVVNLPALRVLMLEVRARLGPVVAWGGLRGCGCGRGRAHGALPFLPSFFFPGQPAVRDPTLPQGDLGGVPGARRRH